jgi:eukaryotic-like serine/threonine-protein kinase
VTAPPPPPRDDPLDETLAGPPDGRRVIVDEGGPAPPVRPYPWWLWVLVVLFLAAAIIFLVLWLMERNNGTRNVPSLVGLSLAQAQNKAAARGFVLKTVRRPAARPPGTVADQAPQSGADLQRGSTVLVVVSSGRQQPTVPKLIGSKAAAAQQLLTAQGLHAITKTVASTNPSGIVVAQDPTDGTRLPAGSAVTLSVSSGQGQVKVPLVEGLSQNEAVTAVAKAGLLPVVIQVPSKKSVGTVLAQDPPANQRVPARSKVRMNVSGGPASTQTVTVTTSQTSTATTTQTTTTAHTTTVRTTTP